MTGPPLWQLIPPGRRPAPRVEFTAACPACGQDATWVQFFFAPARDGVPPRDEQPPPQCRCGCTGRTA